MGSEAPTGPLRYTVAGLIIDLQLLLKILRAVYKQEASKSAADCELEGKSHLRVPTIASCSYLVSH